ncbi:hypothetical protein RFI_09969 [Reticulomyxa filosa]|uniref:Uncharacterized protein n=1 Tax=Reticulomyxa filosa TaxID=46433 RepID=X6NN74_RETFI|nr:hypothetical protein RFI_09969 [Reticulomyxa filosa]|eukprot:ETO27169.1 hypothetical protein RFI_09969 [Reticulomyxa filosa]
MEKEKSKEKDNEGSKVALGDLRLNAPFTQTQTQTQGSPSQQKLTSERRRRTHRKRSTIVSPIDCTKLSFAQATPFPAPDLSESPPPPALLQTQKGQGQASQQSPNKAGKKQSVGPHESKTTVPYKTPSNIHTIANSTVGLSCIQRLADRTRANDNLNKSDSRDNTNPKQVEKELNINHSVVSQTSNREDGDEDIAQNLDRINRDYNLISSGLDIVNKHLKLNFPSPIPEVPSPSEPHNKTAEADSEQKYKEPTTAITPTQQSESLTAQSNRNGQSISNDETREALGSTDNNDNEDIDGNVSPHLSTKEKHPKDNEIKLDDNAENGNSDNDDGNEKDKGNDGNTFAHSDDRDQNASTPIHLTDEQQSPTVNSSHCNREKQYHHRPPNTIATQNKQNDDNNCNDNNNNDNQCNEVDENNHNVELEKARPTSPDRSDKRRKSSPLQETPKQSSFKPNNKSKQDEETTPQEDSLSSDLLNLNVANEIDHMSLSRRTPKHQHASDDTNVISSVQSKRSSNAPSTESATKTISRRKLRSRKESLLSQEEIKEPMDDDKSKGKTQAKGATKKKKPTKRKMSASPSKTVKPSKRIRSLLDVAIPPKKNNNPNLRRSTRVRLKPVKHWAAETVPYSKEILTYDTLKAKGNVSLGGIDYLEENEKLFAKQRRKKGKGKSKKLGDDKSTKKKTGKSTKEESVDENLSSDGEGNSHSVYDCMAWVYDSVSQKIKEMGYLFVFLFFYYFFCFFQ